jgi:hypothetical protein
MPVSWVVTIWKYCGYRVAMLQTLVAAWSNGGLPLIASTVETELANAMSALPASIALTLAMPAPGMT